MQQRRCGVSAIRVTYEAGGASDAPSRSMTPHSSATSSHDVETSEPVAVSWVGLMVPFVLVLAAALVFGSRSPGLVMLLIIPFAIALLRKRAKHRD